MGINKSDIKKILDTQDFYEVMQQYRHSSMNDQTKVLNSFNNVKEWIVDSLSEKLSIEIKITDEQMNDLLVSAIEGGINYWCGYVSIKENTLTTEQSANIRKLSDCISIGGTLIFHDAEDGDKYELTKEKLIKGMKKTLEWSDETNINDLIDNHDAEVVDVLIQFSLFDELVFG